MSLVPILSLDFNSSSASETMYKSVTKNWGFNALDMYNALFLQSIPF